MTRAPIPPGSPWGTPNSNPDPDPEQFGFGGPLARARGIPNPEPEPRTRTVRVQGSGSESPANPNLEPELFGFGFGVRVRGIKLATPTTLFGPGAPKLQPLQRFGIPEAQTGNPYNTLGSRRPNIATPTTLSGPGVSNLQPLQYLWGSSLPGPPRASPSRGVPGGPRTRTPNPNPEPEQFGFGVRVRVRGPPDPQTYCRGCNCEFPGPESVVRVAMLGLRDPNVL